MTPHVAEYLASYKPRTRGNLLKECQARMETLLITEVLAHFKGNQSKAALALGITRGCLREKLKQYNIKILVSVC